MAGALTRDTAIFALTPAADQTDKEGYAVKIVTGEAAISTAHNNNFGVILDGETTSGKSTIASMAGASGTVKVKLSGTVALGGHLMVHTDGTWKAHTGSNNLSAVAMEAGTATELIEAALCVDTHD
tara:strand:- start:3743 stop:4120 length:378 start_codon:yes stop_codon:yes gene_type:complete